MRIEVIEPADRSGRELLLARAFALRHRVFVEGRGWEFLRRPDGLDVDLHDRGATTHILVLDRNRLLGHVRLIPGGYLAVARADSIRIREAAGDAAIYGLSRFCVAPQMQSALTRRIATARLFVAAVCYVMDRGCYAMLFDTDPSMIFLLRALGFTLTDVGEPAQIAGRQMQPVVLRLDASVLSGLPLMIEKWTRAPRAAVHCLYGLAENSLKQQQGGLDNEKPASGHQRLVRIGPDAGRGGNPPHAAKTL